MNLEIPDTLEGQVADLYRRMADHERRTQNKRRTGKVIEVNAKKGLARVSLGKDVDGTPFESGWIPWQEIAAGAIKTHIPPAVGEMVDVVSESGDLGDAMITTSLPSNANPRPHDKEKEGVITVGNVRIHVKDGLASIKVGDSELRIEPGKIVLITAAVHLGGEGGQLVHRKGDNDSDGDVAVGSATKVFAI